MLSWAALASAWRGVCLAAPDPTGPIRNNAWRDWLPWPPAKNGPSLGVKLGPRDKVPGRGEEPAQQKMWVRLPMITIKFEFRKRPEHRPPRRVMRTADCVMTLCRQVNTNSQPTGLGSDHHRPLQESVPHSVWSQSRRAITYPDRATTLPQVPRSHGAGPDRTWPCRLRSADIRMSEVRARGAG
jgi:hypothetical protein